VKADRGGRPNDDGRGGVGLFNVPERPLEVLNPLESQTDGDVRVAELRRVRSQRETKRERGRKAHNVKVRAQSSDLSLEDVASTDFGELRLQEESLLEQELLSRKEMTERDNILDREATALLLLFLRFCFLPGGGARGRGRGN
jgi:hypothetical protein